MEETADILTPIEAARLDALKAAHGDARAYHVGGRRWFLRKPRRVEWLKFKTDTNHTDPVTRVRAGEMLARACLAPLDAAGSVDAERTAFDAMGEDCPALPDMLGMLAVQLAAGPHQVTEGKPPSSSAPPSATRE